MVGEHGEWFFKSAEKLFRPPLELLAGLKVQLRILGMNWS